IIALLLVILVIDSSVFFFFSFNQTSTTEIYTLSLHDALPILAGVENQGLAFSGFPLDQRENCGIKAIDFDMEEKKKTMHRNQLRSEEHTSELQSRRDLVCRLLLEKKKKKYNKKIKKQDRNTIE